MMEGSALPAPQTREDLDKDTKVGTGFSVPAKLQVAQCLREVSLFSPTFKHRVTGRFGN